MTWVDTVIPLLIIVFLILIVWSKIQHQTMKETIFEIRDILVGLKPNVPEVIKK